MYKLVTSTNGKTAEMGFDLEYESGDPNSPLFGDYEYHFICHYTKAPPLSVVKMRIKDFEDKRAYAAKITGELNG